LTPWNIIYGTGIRQFGRNGAGKKGPLHGTDQTAWKLIPKGQVLIITAKSFKIKTKLTVPAA
jgi:hypothetical protein